MGRDILGVNGHIIVHGWHSLEKLTKCHGSKEDRASYLAKGRYGDIRVVHRAGDVSLLLKTK